MTDIFSTIDKQIENIDAKIESIVENATNSKNYEKLNQKINDMVNDSTIAFEKGYEKAENVVKEQSRKIKTSMDVQQEKIKQHTETFKKPPIKDLFAKKDGAYVGGIAMAVIGFILVGLLSLGIITMWILHTALSLGIFSGINNYLLVPLFWIFLLIAFIGMFIRSRIKRFRKYIQVLDGKMYTDVRDLATSINKSEAFVRKDLKRMIAANWFKEGNLAHDEKTLIVSKEAYDEYKINYQRTLEEEQRLVEIKLMHDQLPTQARAIIQSGEDLIRKISEKKVAISEYEMTIRLSHLELVLKKIFKRVELQPEVVPAMRKMMDYYLPTTVKLLEAYEQLDKQAVQGNNILSAKIEIEGSLDTLISAYEKLLDDLFQNVMLDVSTDITVLNTMLAQDGLKNDDFENSNKRG